MRKMTLEIKDLDDLTMLEEIQEAIKRELFILRAELRISLTNSFNWGLKMIIIHSFMVATIILSC